MIRTVIAINAIIKRIQEEAANDHFLQIPVPLATSVIRILKNLKAIDYVLEETINMLDISKLYIKYRGHYLIFFIVEKTDLLVIKLNLTQKTLITQPHQIDHEKGLHREIGIN